MAKLRKWGLPNLVINPPHDLGSSPFPGSQFDFWCNRSMNLVGFLYLVKGLTTKFTHQEMPTAGPPSPSPHFRRVEAEHLRSVIGTQGIVSQMSLKFDEWLERAASWINIWSTCTPAIRLTWELLLGRTRSPGAKRGWHLVCGQEGSHAARSSWTLNVGRRIHIHFRKRRVTDWARLWWATFNGNRHRVHLPSQRLCWAGRAGDVWGGGMGTHQFVSVDLEQKM